MFPKKETRSKPPAEMICQISIPAEIFLCQTHLPCSDVPLWPLTLFLTTAACTVD